MTETTPQIDRYNNLVQREAIMLDELASLRRDRAEAREHIYDGLPDGATLRFGRDGIVELPEDHS